MKELIKRILHEESQEVYEGGSSLNTQQFIDRSKQIHGDLYNYDGTVYTNYKTKLTIECPKHGFFTQLPGQHFRGQGCPVCGREKSDIKRKLTQNDFLVRSKKAHGDTYDYSESIYEKESIPIKIICKKHGPFFQTPYNHYGNKQGCPKCANEKKVGSQSKSIKDFVDDAISIHGNQYDYSLVDYKNNKKPITIICKQHGPFTQIPSSHLSGQGCPICANNIKKTNDEFIQDAKGIHGNKYDYSLVQYKNGKQPVTVICPKHKEFEVTPSNHLRGSGCPICQESRGERLVSLFLENNKITFERQKKFKGCFRTGKNGKRCYYLPFDFYLPKYNTVIEYDGIQHFKPVGVFGGEKAFEQNKLRDELKTLFCQNNDIKIIRIPYTMKTDDVNNFILRQLQIK